MKRTLAATLALLLACVLPLAAQSLTGTITGTVKDDQGGVLPGATVKLTGKTGSRSTTSDAEGVYRFAGVDPGAYSVTAELSGFRPRRQENVVVAIGRTAEIDLMLAVGDMTESVEVVAEAPVVDVTSSATDNTLSQDMLFNLPIRPDNAATDLLNYLPGINNESAFGGNEAYGNALLVDGVDTRDPAGGSAWTFFNYNLVDEVQVGGLGASAEYGSYTGAVVNTVTKSGGNRYAGLFDVYWTRKSFFGDNIKPEYIAQNPSLVDPSVTTKKLDVTGQLGGPIIPDKLFFFVAAQRFEVNDNPSGPIEKVKEVSPRFNTKLTWLPGPSDNLTLSFQWDYYNVVGRCDFEAANCSQALTTSQDSPEAIWGLQWRHLFGAKTFLELKYTGWWGYYYLDPDVEAPLHIDGSTNGYTGGAGYHYYADRGRNQLNASVSHYAEAFGKHDLKFGVEIERSRVHSRYGQTDGLYYYDLTDSYPRGQYLAYDYSFDVEGDNQRESLYAQDAWTPTPRLTINAGVRVDFDRGRSPVLEKTLYSNTNWAPRIGFAFDATGDGKTVLKGHYGQYYDGIYYANYREALPGRQDFVAYAYEPTGTKCGPEGNCFSEVDRSPSFQYAIDPNMKHPRLDEWTAGFERDLGRAIRLSATGVWRKDKNVQGTVYPDARWTARTVANDLSGQPLTVYSWANRSASEEYGRFINVDGFQYLDPNGNVIGTARTDRTYKALMLVLDKRFSGRWSARVSYVLSRAEGVIDNDSYWTYGQSTFYETPTRALVNSFGRLTNDRTHELKAFGTWIVPKVELNLSAYYSYVTGRTYTPYQRYGSRDISFPLSSGRQPFLEPRGSRRLDPESLLDLRVEKIFAVTGFGRFAVFADIQNVFNSSVVTEANSRYPSVAVAGYEQPIAFEGPTEIVQPRRFLLGARWSF
jgi:hypothetical protein